MKVPYNTGKLALVLKVMLLSFIGWNNISAQDTGSFTDPRDGNTYSWVTLGNQTWMSENLLYLPQVDTATDGSEDVPDGKYYYVYDFAPDPDEDETTQISNAKASVNYQTYGVLYNWYAAMDGEASSTSNPSGVQGVCPVGWHLPSDPEWSELETWLSDNGYGYEGSGNDIAKALADSTLWTSHGTPGNVGNDLASNNSSGFSGLPAGIRSTSGSFNYIDSTLSWWSSSQGALSQFGL